MSNDNTLLPSELNQICDRFEDAWQQAPPTPGIADFLAGVPASSQTALLRQLLAIDIEYRCRQDPSLDPAIYTVLGAGAVDNAQSILSKKSAIETPTMGSDEFQIASGQRPAKPEPDETRSAKPFSRPNESQQIGPYKLLQQIGEGGMGTVWMAEQQHPVRRRVALKVIKAGMDN